MNNNLDIFYNEEWIETYSHIYFLHKDYAIWGDAGVLYKSYVQVVKYENIIIDYEPGESRVLTQDVVTIEELEYILARISSLLNININDIDICRIV